MPQAPLPVTRVPCTVSLRPPERRIPVPTGTVAAIPSPGVLGLLLSCTELYWISVQDVPGWPGHEPSWGDGRSSLASVVEAIPTRLWSHSENSSTRWPPALVPEKPCGLFCACTLRRTALQSGQAPT